MMFQRILVAVDFSHHSSNALKLALQLANRSGAQLRALHVDPLPGVGTIAIEPIYIAPQLFEGLHAEHDAKVEKNLREIRDELAGAAAPGVSVDTVLRRGPTVERIVEVAQDWSADLLVMGSQGASGVAHMILGSTAEKVSRVAPCPVLIAGRADDLEHEPRRPRRVIAAVDYSDLSEPVAKLAISLVEPGGRVELVHAWHAPYLSALNSSLGGTHGSVVAMLEIGQKAQSDMIQGFASRLAVPHERCKISHYVATGMPAGAILERAEEIGADLVVMGSHGRTGLGERVLGTVADRVLRYAEMAVAIYPRRALAD